MSTLVTGVLLAPMPAQADVAPPRAALVAPLEGFVAIDGLDDNEMTTIEVRRNGVLVSSVTAKPADWGVPGALEVNHLADPTLCWEGSTPEILPGDVVHVIGSGANPANTFEDTIEIIDLKITQEPVSTGPGQVTVKGFVGTPRPDIALLDVFLRIQDGTKFFASDPGNSITYDNAVDGSWTAEFNGLTPAQATAALNPRVLEAEFARAANEIIAAPPGDVQGNPEDPACPPLARHAVTSIAPAVVNIDNSADGVIISGVTANATNVEVLLNGGESKDVAPDGTGATQTWTVDYTGAELNGLNGTVEVTTVHTTAGGDIDGKPMSFVRDVTAPAAPGVSPTAGTYDNSVEVTMTPPEAGADIFYTLDGTAPSAASTKYTGPFNLTDTTTVRAMAVDSAGNPSASSTDRVYTIAKPPGLPANLSASADDGSATLMWDEGPTNNSAITGYRVRAITGGEEPVIVDVGSAVRSHKFNGLTNGKAYTLSVRATNSAGDGNFAEAAPVTPTGPPSAPMNASAAPGNGSAQVTWQAPADNGGTPITGYKVFTYEAALQVGVPKEFGPEATGGTIDGLTNGSFYTFRVVAMNAKGDSVESAPTAVVRPEERPLQPTILKGRDGRPGGAITAVARWLPPTANTATLENYVVQAWKVRKGKRNVLKGEAVVGADRRMKRMHLPRGVYRFRVRAVGIVDDSRWSKRSPKVRAR